ncbi:unnamed protein product [Cyprideis torosa]|uniref:tetrahydrofolate synthase n=1 Tax=Cyprideis torosa TaxID=163714 RepID=A0A7R8ZMU7_9CRUS|nr:unnamed protein product [Cyprideis torosa]CAG0889902.1 unnamed protein product [Cyprideis torosa]
MVQESHAPVVRRNGTVSTSEVQTSTTFECDFQYKEAVKKLNGLQSNADVLRKRRENWHNLESENVPAVVKFLGRIGRQQNDLQRLHAVHVAGTKVRERIRINGVPLDKAKFTKYFNEVYGALESKQDFAGDMPPYFKFLTVLGFHVFLAESVDVAIVEVGIGGQYDCTNVIQHPWAVGITTLDIEHVHLLGSTIEEIAWQKAGILKPGAKAYTASQCSAALAVIENRAKERECRVGVVPPLPVDVELGIRGQVQRENAALAVRLANAWVQKFERETSSSSSSSCGPPIPLPTGPHSPTSPPSWLYFEHPLALQDLSANVLRGLGLCRWPGRAQILRTRDAVFFLDGAHTQNSCAMCSKWFQSSSEEENTAKASPVKRVLIFSCTGERDPRPLLAPLALVGFEVVIFCPTVVKRAMDVASDQTNFTQDEIMAGRQLRRERESWLDLTSCEEKSVHVCASISEALDRLQDVVRSGQPVSAVESLGSTPPHVLVTGSLHLVGGVLGLIQDDPAV